MTRSRRQLLLTTSALSALALAGMSGTGIASAQELQRISLVVGYPPGGATDVLARFVAEGLQSGLGVPVIVENKAGAGARLATDYVKKAKNDGSVLLFSISSPMVIYPHIYKKLGYDPVRDFAPIGIAARTGMCLAVGPMVPASVKTAADYVAWVKASPSMTMFGTVQGSAPHFAGVLFGRAAGIDLQLVPYKGGAQAVTDLLGGQLPATVTPISEVQPFAADGKLRILAVTGTRRSKVLPDVPTMAELGYKGVDLQTWIGVMAPLGTPPATLARIGAALDKTLRTDAAATYISKLGMEVAPSTADAFAAQIRSDYEQYGKAVELTGFKIDE